MSKENNARSGCKDVFHAFLVTNATYDGDLEMPCIKSVDKVPNKLIVFSKAIRSKDLNGFVHFFEDDVNFERVWKQPNKYLPILERFDGVITPDFSLYRDMPLVNATVEHLQKPSYRTLVTRKWYYCYSKYPIC